MTSEYTELNTARDIFDAWEQAARGALETGQSYAPEIFNPNGDTVRGFKMIIQDRLDQGDRFTEADHRNSTRVARDLGRICSIIASAQPRQIVTLEAFKLVFQLVQLHHDACRPPIERGRWCSRPE